MAVGKSYPESGGVNESAVHTDLVCDLRLGGKLIVDGEDFQVDGKFVSNNSARVRTHSSHGPQTTRPRRTQYEQTSGIAIDSGSGSRRGGRTSR